MDICSLKPEALTSDPKPRLILLWDAAANAMADHKVTLLWMPCLLVVPWSAGEDW
jgi:hypothetical protein